ncbi:RHS repeat-associated core domain-containing protein (plasmid) [Pantoea agglomerans]|uniref:RHS repeat-associated core domain-containing protein n=1 Tax=Enterobacter agglomerans TaxID=549 RepID=UPI002ED39E4F|nr:RHS repeat-associated core domain-containing protein [Pantoea agglomerans]
MLLISIPETTRFIRHGHACLGVAGPDGLTLTAGGHSDSTLWSRNTASPDGHLHTWSPWGAGDTTGGLPGFNGERPDPVSGSYHLGNGYRTYSPALRRFTCPDSLSPFGAGGINPYAYCAGDPINRTDPTGHISWQGIVGIVGGIVGLGLSFIGGYMAIAAAEGIAAAVSSASATSLVVGGLGVAADVTAIASGATEDVNPAASSVLGWVSMATGIAGIAAGTMSVRNQLIKGRSSEMSPSMEFRKDIAPAFLPIHQRSELDQKAFNFIVNNKNIAHIVDDERSIFSYSTENTDNQFHNRYRRNTWVFEKNFRETGQPYFASHIAEFQYNIVSAIYGDKEIYMPKKIIRSHVINKITLSKTKNLTGDELTRVFLQETPNGKSTQRILDTFGLRAESVMRNGDDFIINLFES